jgi:nucleotide-binding universal stress UspA family protein
VAQVAQWRPRDSFILAGLPVTLGVEEAIMVHIKHILCPIDFSEFSRHALDRALVVARAHDATVTVLHVLPTHVVAPAGVPFGPEGPGAFTLYQADRETAADELARFVSGSTTRGVPVQHQLVEAPSSYREILVQADRLGADLIVMGTHGRSGFDRLMIGSVTEKVLRRARVPVLTVPSHAADVDPLGPPAFQRILCAVDFSDCSLLAIAHAAALAQEANSTFTIVHVAELLPVAYEPTIATPFDFELNRPALEEAARGHLKRIVPAGIREQCRVEDVVVSGKPYVEILKVAGERRADLIVLGVHGYGVLDRLVFGSTAGHVVRQATCPVLTVRERDEHHRSNGRA